MLSEERPRPRPLAQIYGRELNDSTTPTPLHTRTHSPVRPLAVPHTPVVAEATMEQLHAIFQEREAEKVEVAVVDGSAAVATQVKLVYLAIYFLLNLGLTLYNKAVMIKVSSVPHLEFRILFSLPVEISLGIEPAFYPDYYR